MLEYLADPRGVLLRRDARRHGVTDPELSRLVRSGELIRLRHGAYALAARWYAADEVDRHLMLAGAVMSRWGDRRALSHHSAALELGAPNFGFDLSHVGTTDLFGRSDRRRARVVHHRGVLRATDVTRTDGFWITDPARTALDLAAALPRDAGVVVIDNLLHRGLTTLEELRHRIGPRVTWPDHAQAQRTLACARVGAESVGETLLRLIMRDAGLPEPILQFPVHDRRGWLIGRSDLAIPELKVLIEFDGLKKYHQHLRPGETIEQMVMREKRREDRLRELTGWVVVRFVWSDLANPRAVRDRILGAAAVAAAAGA